MAGQNNGNGNGNNNAANKNIHGTGDNDFLEGNDANNKIYGDLGDDVLLGLEGNDHLFGDDGDDELKGGTGNDKLEGGDGNDSLTGGAGNDNIIAGAGDDTVTWSAGDRNDTVDGGEGEDTFDLNTSANYTQSITLGVDSDGNIVISAGGAEGGDLVLSGIEKINLNISSKGASLTLGPNLPPGLFGTQDEPLELDGGDEPDVIDVSSSDQAVAVNAGGGDDTVNTGGGSDTIAGGAGDDTINAGGGDDTVQWQAGEGNDNVDGGDGFDALDLNLDSGSGDPNEPPPTLTITSDANGNVILQSSTGETLTMKGVEDVIINAAPAGSTITIGDLTGTDIAQDTLYFVGGAGIDSLDASATDRRIHAQGNGGDDILLSGSGNDFLDGGAGNDFLNAGSGSGVDTVLGGSGDDTIEVTLGDEQGSNAVDIVDGGADNDTLNVHFTEPTPHDLFLNVNSNGDGSFSITSEDIDIDETVRVSNVENLVITADEPGLNYNLGALADTTLQNVSFQGSAGADSFNGSNTDISVSLSGNGGDDNLIGGSQGDWFAGGEGNDSLDGEGGNDWLIGGAGNDILDGGADWDTADYTGAAGGVAVDLTNNQAQDTLNAGNDTLVNVEAVEGSAFGDTLTGNDNDNYLSGNDGDDVISGGGGFDTLRGGAGNDTLTDADGRISGDAGNDTLSGAITYIHDGNGVAVNMSAGDIDVGGTITAGTARDGYGDTDTLDTNSGFVEGTNFGDHLEGAEGNQVFWGRAGDDTLRGNGGDDRLQGGSGTDDIDGGDGIDFVNYFNDGQDAAGPGAGAIINLATGTATDNWGDTDTLSNVENVIGSLQADTITGDDNANVIFTLGGGDTVAGGAGNDTLIDYDGDSTMDGGDGDDILVGARGNDTLTGGSGADTYRFTTTESGDTDFGHDTITDFDVAEDVLDLSPFEQFGAIEQLDISEAGGNTTITLDADRSITLNGVSAATLVAANFIFGGEPPPVGGITGTEGNDVLTGTAAAESLSGLGGNDQLEGGAGNDTLDGGDDTDTAFYANDPAAITANLETGVVTDGYGDADTLINIERIVGSQFNDTITGSSGKDFLIGQGGDDTINAGGGDDNVATGEGNDVVDGGAGFDQVFMVGDTIGQGFPFPGMSVVYNGDGTITATNKVTGETDTYSNIEAIHSSAGDDDITGDAGNNFIGLSGGLTKTVDGGDGIDTLRGPGNPNGIQADMTAGTVVNINNDGSVGGTAANFTNIENVIGGIGNDTITGDGNDNILEGGGGSDFLTGGAGNDTLNGGPSTVWTNPGETDDGQADTAGYLDDPAGIIADLATGTVTDGYGGTDTLTSIENIQGSNFDDTITGDAGNNVIWGNGGIDILSGGDGDDAIIGGAGIDILDGGAGRDTVFFTGDGIGIQATGLTIEFNNTDNTISAFNPGTGETEIVDNFELVFGTLGHDQITGDDGNNFINGLFGDDVIDGGAGADTVYFVGQVNVDLSAGTAAQANAFLGAMSLANIENVVGTSADDVISGDAGANILEGDRGNDVLRGGAGNDTLHGGRSLLPGDIDPAEFGVDTADYSQDGAGVTVDLGAGNATDGNGGSDTLVAIDNVIGSAFNDSLTGDDNANELEGLAGDDTLTGGAGADSFRLTDDGNDNADFGQDVVTDFNLNEDVINLRDFSNINEFSQITSMIGQDGADTLIDFGNGNSIRLQGITATDINASHFDFIENLYIEGTEGNDNLEGDDGNDTINALGGNDQVRGYGGNDTIDGGNGGDQLWGGDGDDTIEGGDDWDNIYGEAGNDILTDSANGAYMSGGEGDDLMTAINSNANMDGGAGNDVLTGASNQWNHMRGEDGDDVLNDPDGSGFLFGGPGKDSLDGQVNYAEDPAGIYANLSGSHDDGNSWDVHGDGTVLVASRTAIDGWGDTDTLEAGVGNSAFNASQHDDFIKAAEFTSQGFNLFAGDDTLIAGSGSVWVSIGSGSDYLDGGADWDSLNAWQTDQDAAGLYTQGLVINLSNQDFEYEPGQTALANRLVDPWGFTDEVYNFESVNGTEFDDVMVGGEEHNWLDGGEGNDRLFGGDIEGDNLIGGAGDDYLDGQGGNWDTAWYNQWLWDENGQVFDAPGIVADMNAGTVQDQYGGTDTLVSIEQIEGSPYNDSITGDANDNRLLGNEGDDVIDGGAGHDNLEGRDGDDEVYGGDGDDWLVGGQGIDLIDGGAGRDQVNYDAWIGTTSGINIDLTAIGDFGGYTNVVQTPDGQGGMDYLRGIEDISGTDHDDTMVGDANDNRLVGHVGNDNLSGGEGNDWLDGGDDFDTLDGGAGFDNLEGGENDDTLTGGAEGDVFRFSNFTNQRTPTSFGEDVITDFNPAEDTLDFNDVPEFNSPEAVAAAASEVGEHLVLSFDGDYGFGPETNSITLQGLTLADLPNLNIWYSPIVGTDGNDTLNGGASSEFFQAAGGDDVVNAGDGNDRLEGGAGNDTLNGEAGDDYFIGGSGNDTINGGGGNDYLAFWGSRETLDFWQEPFHGLTIDMSLASGQVVNDGFDNTDTLVSIETISGTDFNDSFNGGSGNDNFQGNGGDDTIAGNDGDDFFLGGDGNDQLYGGNGNDWFQPGQGNDYIDGGAGQDHVNLDGWQQPGGVNVDLTLATNQVIDDGFGTSDTLVNIQEVWGGQLNDTITGDAGNNNLGGNFGDDVLNGGDGDDWLDGDNGNDQLFGGNGNDGFQGGRGADLINGGAGWDHVNYDHWEQQQGVNVDLDGGIATDEFGFTDTLVSIEDIFASQFDDTLTGDDNDNNLSGNGGNDVINGAGGMDNVNGNDGNDILDGGDGNDSLHGGNGNDTLTGGLGDDYLVGGAGDDLFVFSDGDTGARDHIDDFVAGAGTEDVISLAGIASLNAFADVTSNAIDDGFGNTNIDLGNGNILHLRGVSSGQLHEDDFTFV